jgi:hypothetical protein
MSKIIKYSALCTVLFSALSNAANCTSTPVNPNGDVSKLKNALQQATNTGIPLQLTGTYFISKDTKVWLKKDLIVDATGATFIATSDLDGDMFSFDANDRKSIKCNSANVLANFKWKGGDFNMADAKVSKVVPHSNSTPVGREGSVNTADALSIRGTTHLGVSKLNELVIENITYTGTKSSSAPFYEAGGDSGILMGGALKATIRNNAFYGVRDAGIYVTAAGDNGKYGDHYLIENNYIERAYDGITSKRGADNIKMLGNTMQDVVVGLSIKRVFAGWTATNVAIKGNFITASARSISVERANNVTIEDNTIIDLGAEVNGESRPRNKYGNHFEAIALNGVQGKNKIRYNSIAGVTGDRADSTTTYGIVTRYEDGRETTGEILDGNTFYGIDHPVMRFTD